MAVRTWQTLIVGESSLRLGHKGGRGVLRGSGLGFRVQGLGFRVQGLLFRVWDCGNLEPETLNRFACNVHTDLSRK